MKKRDLIIAGVTMIIMGIPLAILAKKYQEAVVMQSSAFDWNNIKATPTKVGEVRKFFQSPTATLDELECHVSTLRPGMVSHAPHQHPDEELMIVKEGILETLVNGEIKTVGVGSVVFWSANQLHNSKNVGSTPATYHIVKWKSAKTEKTVKTN